MENEERKTSFERHRVHAMFHHSIILSLIRCDECDVFDEPTSLYYYTAMLHSK